MKFKRIRFQTFAFTIPFLFLFYGCPGSGEPKITLTVTDCPVQNITIEENTRVTTQTGNQWTMSTTITVKCNGKPAKNADIKVKFWWPKGTFKLTTNEKGKVRKTKRGQGARPTGEKFTVTIVGSDGEKPQEFTIQ